MNIYTRGGDRGETDLLGGIRGQRRLAPASLRRFRRTGRLAGTGSMRAVARRRNGPAGADSTPNGRSADRAGRRSAGESIGEISREIGRRRVRHCAEDVEAIEQAIDRCSATLEPVRAFILPAGCPAAAALHVARAVCRRAERNMATLARSEPQIVTPAMSAYVNRLSDLLFVLARSANANAGVSDVPC